MKLCPLSALLYATVLFVRVSSLILMLKVVANISNGLNVPHTHLDGTHTHIYVYNVGTSVSISVIMY